MGNPTPMRFTPYPPFAAARHWRGPAVPVPPYPRRQPVAARCAPAAAGPATLAPTPRLDVPSMDADRLASSISPIRRYLILATVVVACSLYSTALLTTSTILPQLQGAMSATQDEIAWAMT